MNARVLILLALGAVAAIVLALVLVDRPEEQAAADGSQLLLPGLPDRINELGELEIVAPDGETIASLHRERGRWRLRQMHDYEADFARIHGLLRELARARRVDGKTENPDWYGRLGVASPGDGEGAGTLIAFGETDLPAVVIGKVDPAGIGSYVRLDGHPRAWLIDRELDVSRERLDWVETGVMDIPASDIAELSVRHPGADRVELRPGDQEGSNWVLLDPPAGRDVRPAWRLRESASALSRLAFEDVRPHDAELVPDDAVETVFRTRDGLVFEAVSFNDEAGRWLHFRVREDETGSSAGESAESVERAADETDAPDDAELDIVAVDGRLAPWQFALSEERFERFRPTTEDLLEDPPDGEG